MITRVVTSLTKETCDLGGSVAVSVIKLADTNGSNNGVGYRDAIRTTLGAVDIKTVGRNFLAIVGIEAAEVLMEYAKNTGLVNIENQWLYVISDMNRSVVEIIFRGLVLFITSRWSRYKADVSHLRKLLKEGDNVAFIYNTTGSGVDCVVIGLFFSYLHN